MEKKLLKRIEGMEDGERDKLRELLKDSNQLAEGRLAWMYKDKVDDEEYLLGRRIDSTALSQPEPTSNDSPGALFNEVITRRSEMDMQVKMREDPLYAIRKKEEETRRRLLENPIRMKQLQKTIEQQKTQLKHKEKKKKSKKRRKKDSSDDDDDLLRQYLSIVNRKKSTSTETQMEKQEHRFTHKTTDKPLQSADRSDSDRRQPQTASSDVNEDGSRRLHNRSPDRRRYDDRQRHRTKQGSGSADDSERKRVSHSRDNLDKDKSNRARPGRTRHDSESRDRTETSQPDDDDRGKPGDSQSSHTKHRSKHSHQRHPTEAEEETPEAARGAKHGSSSEDETPANSRRNAASYGLIVSSRAAAATTHKSKTHTPVMPAPMTSTKNSTQLTEKPVKRRLTDEEMAAKRAKMMNYARERDEQRAKNVKRYREDDRRDRLQAEKSAAAAGFVQPMMAQHASESSVEDCIKRNIYSIQRTPADLDKNFARH